MEINDLIRRQGSLDSFSSGETKSLSKSTSFRKKLLTSKKSDSQINFRSRSNIPRTRTSSENETQPKLTVISAKSDKPESGGVGSGVGGGEVAGNCKEKRLKRSDSDISLFRNAVKKSPRTPRTPLSGSFSGRNNSVSKEKKNIKEEKIQKIGKSKNGIEREEIECEEGVVLIKQSSEEIMTFSSQILNKKGEDTLSFGCFDNYSNYTKPEKIKYYAVFDGHGGKDCACFVAKHLKTMLQKKFKKIDMKDNQKVMEVLSKMMFSLDKKWADASSMDVSGCTASIIVHSQNDLYSVSVGDSKGIVVSSDWVNVVTVCDEQRISKVEEQERLKQLAMSLGIPVLSNGNDVDFDKLVWQIWFEQDKTGEVKKLQVYAPPKIAAKYNMRVPVSNIALSSSIGDPKLGPILYPHPLVHHFPITDKNKHILLLATDGLWDVMNHEEVVKVLRESMIEINQNKDPMDILDAEKVKNFLQDMQVKLPHIAWKKYGPKDHMRDDITLIITNV